MNKMSRPLVTLEYKTRLKEWSDGAGVKDWMEKTVPSFTPAPSLHSFNLVLQRHQRSTHHSGRDKEPGGRQKSRARLLVVCTADLDRRSQIQNSGSETPAKTRGRTKGSHLDLHTRVQHKPSSQSKGLCM